MGVVTAEQVVLGQEIQDSAFERLNDEFALFLVCLESSVNILACVRVELAEELSRVFRQPSP